MFFFFSKFAERFMKSNIFEIEKTGRNIEQNICMMKFDKALSNLNLGSI